MNKQERDMEKAFEIGVWAYNEYRRLCKQDGKKPVGFFEFASRMCDVMARIRTMMN